MPTLALHGDDNSTILRLLGELLHKLATVTHCQFRVESLVLKGLDGLVDLR